MNPSHFEHLPNADHRQPIVHVNYLNVIFPQRHLLYPRCGHPTYNTMETYQTDSSVS